MTREELKTKLIDVITKNSKEPEEIELFTAVVTEIFTAFERIQCLVVFAEKASGPKVDTDDRRKDEPGL